jgi:hypothetical protein
MALDRVCCNELIMDKWQTRRILILGTTYPAHSQKYTETVCTGGIFEDTLEMCRLYPIPHRYLTPGQQFHAFQWISASVTRDTSDPRPESYRVDRNSIVPEEIIPPKDHEIRRGYLERSPHSCKSVEELKERQQQGGTSLGIILPESILDCFIQMRSENERSQWAAKEKARADQDVLFGEKPKPLAFPEAKFCVKWRCQDDRCETHKMNLHQWGIHELYRKYSANRVEAEAKVIQKMRERLDQWNSDVFLFLGNFRDVLFNFGLMDSYSAPRKCVDENQFSLFDKSGNRAD